MMDTEELWQIPDYWKWTQIKSLGEVVAGGTPSTKEPTYWGDDVNWISPSDLTGYSSKTIAHGAKGLSKLGLKTSSAKVMPAGSVHFSSRAPIGYVAISSQPIATNQGFKSLVPAQGVFNEYVYYYLKGSKQLAEKRASGTTFLELSGTAFGLLPVPLPPTKEQSRIVAKIEELFSDLDMGVESLMTAREQLKIYRQAVLKHALQGRLTQHWYNENRRELPDSHSMTTDLEDNRRRAWYNPKLTFRRGSYRPPVAYDTEDIPNVPERWALVSMDALCHHITSGSRGWSKFYDRGNSTFIMAQNIRPGRYDGSFVQRIDPPEANAETERTRAKLDDLLVTIVGANTGNLCRFNLDVADHYVCQSVALMRLVRPEYARFLELYFQSQDGGLRQYNRYIYGAGRPHLSFEQLKQTVVPLPSVEEAQTIADVVDQILTDLNSLEESIEVQLNRCDALRHSILKRAFSGQLVNQDPNDEPASVLLERIKAEKGAQTKLNKNNKRKDAA